MADGLDAHDSVETAVPASRSRVQNVAFTLLIIAITLLLLRFMQPVLIPLVLGVLCPRSGR
jgi:predicted PurR-regulated permease PerM